jgi:hypothetical protein
MSVSSPLKRPTTSAAVVGISFTGTDLGPQ